MGSRCGGWLCQGATATSTRTGALRRADRHPASLSLLEPTPLPPPPSTPRCDLPLWVTSTSARHASRWIPPTADAVCWTRRARASPGPGRRELRGVLGRHRHLDQSSSSRRHLRGKGNGPSPCRRPPHNRRNCYAFRTPTSWLPACRSRIHPYESGQHHANDLGGGDGNRLSGSSTAWVSALRPPGNDPVDTVRRAIVLTTVGLLGFTTYHLL